jgi:hypothetical protein
MARLSLMHMQFTYGAGLCSVPMWSGGGPSGLCDQTAYGRQSPEEQAHQDDLARRGMGGNFPLGLACPRHGGPGQATK